MAIKRTKRLAAYGWKTYEVTGLEDIRLRCGPVEVAISTGRPDDHGNETVQVQIVRPERAVLENGVESPCRHTYIVRVPPQTPLVVMPGQKKS